MQGMQFIHTAIGKINYFLSQGGASKYQLNSFDIAILFALGNYLYHNENCWPSQDTIQKYSNISIRKIRNVLHNLQKKGLISIKKQGKLNSYSLSLPV